ncbi:MAG: hypothetical protein KC505_04710 [Myxococcales bacterium]|nr:hypothetical protein [Myxococcales bacterium]USN49806.1 MAG: hypothetical protein H6731_05855 [Myxococcales bacterium]
MLRTLMLVSVSLLFFSSASGAEESSNNSGSTGYDKGFYVKSSNQKFDLTVNGRVQGRATYQYDKKNELGLTLPAARLGFKGHALDQRFSYNIQLGFDNAVPSLKEFSANFDIFPYGIQFKAGYSTSVGYSWLEGVSSGKQDFVGRSKVYSEFSLGSLVGFSFHNGNQKGINWDIGIYEAGPSALSGKRLGLALGSISYNYGGIDSSTETDFKGGDLRMSATLGGFIKSQIVDWNFVGYGASLGALAKFYGTTVNTGIYLGEPEANPMLVDGKTEQKVSKESMQIGALLQAGHIFQKRYGVGVRYGLLSGAAKVTTQHEVLGSLSLYAFQHNLKLQMDGGVNIKKDSVAPKIEAQIQYAF